jgi:hypothetical protein
MFSSVISIPFCMLRDYCANGFILAAEREVRMNITVYEIKYRLLVCECANILSDFDVDWTLRVYSAWINNISGYHPFEDASVMADL